MSPVSTEMYPSHGFLSAPCLCAVCEEPQAGVQAPPEPPGQEA